MEKLTFDTIREKGLLLYEYVRGSHSYGLNIETSDIDKGGVYICPNSQLLDLGFTYQDQVQDATHDTVWYELNKYMRLLIKSNPNVLEPLFVDDEFVLYQHPVFKQIRDNREMFLTQEAFRPLGAFAIEQIKKCRGLNKKIVNPVYERLQPLDFVYTFYRQGSTKINNWLEYRGLKQQYCGLVNIANMHDTYGCYYDWGNHFIQEGITEQMLKDAYHESTNNLSKMVDFIVDHYKLRAEDNGGEYFYQTVDNIGKWYNSITPHGYSGIVGVDKLSTSLRLSSVKKDEKPICHIVYNESGYTKHCIDYKNYKDWEKHRNPARYESNLNKNYDSKNVMHSFRLIAMCTELAKGEGFNCNRRDIDRDFLLDIRNHKYEYDYIINLLDEKKRLMDEAIASSTLPKTVDVDSVNELLLKIRTQWK